MVCLCGWNGRHDGWCAADLGLAEMDYVYRAKTRFRVVSWGFGGSVERPCGTR
jgi:hypothetical protein